MIKPNFFRTLVVNHRLVVILGVYIQGKGLNQSKNSEFCVLTCFIPTPSPWLHGSFKQVA